MDSTSSPFEDVSPVWGPEWQAPGITSGGDFEAPWRASFNENLLVHKSYEKWPVHSHMPYQLYQMNNKCHRSLL
jgi:hypothetical protein